MEKILAPVDRVLAQIGRLTLARPLFSITLLLVATAVTIYSNEIWKPSGTVPSTTAYEKSLTPPPPVTTPAPTSIAAPLATQSTSASNTPPANTPAAAATPGFVAKTHVVGWQVMKIRSGDTLAKLFQKNGFSAREVATLSHLKNAKALRHLKLGQEIRFYKNTDGRLEQLAYALNDKSTLSVVRAGNTYKATTQARAISTVLLASAGTTGDTSQIATLTTPSKPDTKTSDPSSPTLAKTIPVRTTASIHNYVSGHIKRSLAVDARKTGLSSQQANQLVQIFSQKNIAQNVRPGDEFNVLYERSKTGTKKSTANILAAQLTTRGKTYQLVRFVDPKGHVEYYTPQGHSLHDGLSRLPLNFNHISSSFSGNRLDPVLGYYRPHAGTDLAAAFGTPVQAAGDGVLAEIGYRGGYGKLITIQHDSKYTTRYAHLSKFANSMRAGQTVRKGQIIGYVGRTGYATGPHLHYEIRVNDVATNPLTVALPRAVIPAAYRSRFLTQSKALLTQLRISRQVRLAQASPTSPQRENKG